MSEYQFANHDGSIVVKNYDSSGSLSNKEVLKCLEDAFKAFPYKTLIQQMGELTDVFQVTYPLAEEDVGLSDIYICAKATTPGGRDFLKDEQRIQVRAEYLNSVYDKHKAGKKTAFLGIYSWDGVTIFCAWKVTESKAAYSTSKQIKINTIAKAIKEGFIRQINNNGEYVCAFRPEFLYFYLRNSDWLHIGKANELGMHTTSEKDDLEAKATFSEPVYNTGLHTEFPRNCIVFGAPGTGKSFLLEQKRKELLDEDNGTDYERVTFHPDYSYANFVGTYRPVMVETNGNKLEQRDRRVLSILTDSKNDIQQKNDQLLACFGNDDHTHIPILLGLYDGAIKSEKDRESEATDPDAVEINRGRAIRPYVKLFNNNDYESDGIAYHFVPGPFMRVLANALKSAKSSNPKPYLLVIEEINRANTAAVFGDVFQLLDRDDNNISEYPIQTSKEMREYLAYAVDGINGNPDDYSKIKIPDNMFIWATMNSADQGVFPMDTAFKRRWDFMYLGIDTNEDGIRGKTFKVGSEKQAITWNAIRKAINDFLAKMNINEDKQLGPYFLSRSIILPSVTISEEEKDRRFCSVFKDKVLMYLFEDAARQKRNDLFSLEKPLRYSKICEAFDRIGIHIFNDDIQNNAQKYTSEEIGEEREAIESISDAEDNIDTDA